MTPSSEILQFFSKFIESELGIVYSEANFFQLEARLEEIARTLNLGSVQSFYEAAQRDGIGHFKQYLLDVSTNNETSFFRDPKVFGVIESTILPSLCQTRRPSQKTRIWSAACSTGQEALSVAMLLLEAGKRSATLALDFEITGTDISQRVLDRCKKGIYTDLEVQRGLRAQYLETYFKSVQPGFWTAGDELSRHLQFQRLNLIEPFSFPEQFDLILCRNVLIYQKVESKIAILKKITHCLTDGGYLVLGAGESLMGLSDDFKQVLTEGAVVYQKLKKD